VFYNKLMPLNVTDDTGSQTNTYAPQAAGHPAAGGAQTSNFQPTVAGDLLKSQAGVPLSNQSVSTISLGAAQQTVTSTHAAPAPKHHVNAGALAITVVLLAVAVVLIWNIVSPVKNTTNK
jgi:hypothetical protein